MMGTSDLAEQLADYHDTLRRNEKYLNRIKMESAPMAKLTTRDRKAIPTKDFAGPGRSYPVEDKAHAKAALALLHNAPKSEQAAIRRKAEAKLGKGKK